MFGPTSFLYFSCVLLPTIWKLERNLRARLDLVSIDLIKSSFPSSLKSSLSSHLPPLPHTSFQIQTAEDLDELTQLAVGLHTALAHYLAFLEEKGI